MRPLTPSPALLRLCRAHLRRQGMSQGVLLAKAVLFQCFSVAMTFLISFVMTHDVHMSLWISGYDILVKLVLYYVFDVSWFKLFSHL